MAHVSQEVALCFRAGFRIFPGDNKIVQDIIPQYRVGNHQTAGAKQRFIPRSKFPFVFTILKADKPSEFKLNKQGYHENRANPQGNQYPLLFVG